MQRQLYISLDGQPLETTCRLHLRGQARISFSRIQRHIVKPSNPVSEQTGHSYFTSE